MDPTFAQHVKEWTTRPEFISPLVDHLPAATTVPSPRDVLGHDIGEPRKLDYYEDLLKYYRALAAKSPRVKIIETGKTEEGRPTVVVLISSESNIAHLDANRQNLARLADPRGLTDAQAREIISQTKPMYLALGGLHSAETGPPEMLADSPIAWSARTPTSCARFATTSSLASTRERPGRPRPLYRLVLPQHDRRHRRSRSRAWRAVLGQVHLSRRQP